MRVWVKRAEFVVFAVVVMLAILLVFNNWGLPLPTR